MSNKKKYILIGIGVFLLISLLSSMCSGGSEEVAKKEVILRPAQTEIKGDLKGCYEVVDKNYKVKFATKSYENDVITVELKRTAEPLPYDRKNVVIFPEASKSTAENCAGFGVEILNADGDVIDKKNANATPYSWDEMTTALQLVTDDTATIQFHFDNLNEAASFRVTSIVMENEELKAAQAKAEAKAKKDDDSLIESLTGLAKEAAKLDYDDDDLEDLEKEAELALKAADKTLELAGKMLDVLED
ncbi:MAG: hypothetical protein IKW47_04035 [Alistipes sp.]|nr:hypothetical protein [Alistipes sp.]